MLWEHRAGHLRDSGRLPRRDDTGPESGNISRITSFKMGRTGEEAVLAKKKNTNNPEAWESGQGRQLQHRVRIENPWRQTDTRS